ncbi:MAG: polysaccharide biosynthesis protein, partial [Nitrospiria bacterium]
GRYPRAIFLIDGFLVFLFLSVLRITKRVYAVLTQTVVGARRVLILGAGDAGEMIVRDMVQNLCYQRNPIAFLDDDPKKRSSRIHNIPVAGNIDDLPRVIDRLQPDEILIAMPSATGAQMKRIINRCKTAHLPIKTLPNLSSLISGKVAVTDIRNLDIEDLIGRPEIQIDNPDVAAKIKGKRVLVTGAGGSIGSELCRQVAVFEPERLILYERSENTLYQIQLDLKKRFPKMTIETVLADILDEKRLEQIFTRHRPQIIFHAAAYKHVPMMEENPFNAVRNNIIGTHRVMAAADRHAAEEFVLISTDKAVYPTSVMGATKRVTEIMVRYFDPKSQVKFVSVRFGNVLESNGSVVPLFRDQIKKGEPLTVTHPEIKRYFISIQEAVQLVLQAAVLGKGGEIFVLDMGEPIKVVDLARTMITLSGFSPEDDIPIEFIGLRPGEKMVEALFEKTEEAVRTVHEKIWVAQNGKTPHDLMAYIEKFAAMDHQTDPIVIKARLMELIPGYCSDDPISPPV